MHFRLSRCTRRTCSLAVTCLFACRYVVIFAFNASPFYGLLFIFSPIIALPRILFTRSDSKCQVSKPCACLHFTNDVGWNKRYVEKERFCI